MTNENNQTKSSRGGARANAGRKVGSVTTKTREIAEKCAEMGLTPLEVMIESMIDFYQNGDKEAAVRVAKDAAPYIHPRLSAVEVGSDTEKPLKMVVTWKK
jgi:hypothetical protein